ncbi:MAG: EI24 domain-containing protein, partial [Nitrospinae bacterium]|nr:EI24 domain-containing protein [Nitrospinota bacterium]
RVEDAYYPNSNEREAKFWPDLFHDIKFTIWGLFLNILVLPLYIFSIGFIVSIILNSYILGREFFESAAGYHLGKDKAKELLSKNRTPVYIGGFFVTMTSLIPILNLFIPIIAVVWMTHLYHNIVDIHS